MTVGQLLAQDGNVARILQKGEYGRDELLREVRRLSS